MRAPAGVVALLALEGEERLLLHHSAVLGAKFQGDAATASACPPPLHPAQRAEPLARVEGALRSVRLFGRHQARGAVRVRAGVKPDVGVAAEAAAEPQQRHDAGEAVREAHPGAVPHVKHQHVLRRGLLPQHTLPLHLFEVGGAGGAKLLQLSLEAVASGGQSRLRLQELARSRRLVHAGGHTLLPVRRGRSLEREQREQEESHREEPHQRGECVALSATQICSGEIEHGRGFLSNALGERSDSARAAARSSTRRRRRSIAASRSHQAALRLHERGGRERSSRG